MNQEEFTALTESTIKQLQELLVVKGGEYADSKDRLANFKRGAQLTGVTPLQCAFIYASKHYDAIATFVRDAAFGTERRRSESIEGRLDDLMNYCLLMKGLVREAEPKVEHYPMGLNWCVSRQKACPSGTNCARTGCVAGEAK